MTKSLWIKSTPSLKLTFSPLFSSFSTTKLASGNVFLTKQLTSSSLVPFANFPRWNQAFLAPTSPRPESFGLVPALPIMIGFFDFWDLDFPR